MHFVEAVVLCCILCFCCVDLSQNHTSPTVFSGCGLCGEQGDIERAVCALCVQNNRMRPFLRGMLHSAWPWKRHVCVLHSLWGAGVFQGYPHSGLRSGDTTLWLRSCQSEGQPFCPGGVGAPVGPSELALGCSLCK